MKKFFILSAVLVIFLFACQTKISKPLIVGTNTPYEPMEYRDSSGNLVGLDIDVMNEIGKSLGREIVFREYGWEDLFLAVDAGEVDLAISSITITLERQEKYEFSAPYFNAGQVLLTTGEKAEINKIGVQGETTSKTEAEKMGKEIVIYDDYEGQAIEDLKSGVIDAIMIDIIAAESILKQNPTMKISDNPLTNEFYGIMAKKGNAGLIDEVDIALSKLKELGYLDKITKKWV